MTLVRDSYRKGHNVRELLDYAAGHGVSREDIEDHLLDQRPAGPAQKPGHSGPRYDLQTAHNTLSRLAAQMNHEGTRELRWWNIPRWVTAAPRV